MTNRIGRCVISHKYQLLGFGAERVLSAGEAKQVEVVILNKSDVPTFEKEVAPDLMEILPIFCARFDGSLLL